MSLENRYQRHPWIYCSNRVRRLVEILVILGGFGTRKDYLEGGSVEADPRGTVLPLDRGRWA